MSIKIPAKISIKPKTLFLFFGATLLAFLAVISFQNKKASASHISYPLNVQGFAWSSNIGWISFNCLNTFSCATSGGFDYGVKIDQLGLLTGYAWSPNIGWISFNSSDLTGCPGGSCIASMDAGGNVTGWARALAYQNSEAGGFEGWISLDCSNTSSCGVSNYGVNIDIDTVADSGTGAFSGFAWSGDSAPGADDGVIGWIDFAGGSVGFGDGVYVPLNSAVSLVANPETLPSEGGNVDIIWTTKDVSNCIPSSSPAVSSWDSATISLPNNSLQVNVTNTTTFTLTCTPTDGSPDISDNVIVTVTSSFCGNGIVEAGEQCELPNTPVCDASCQTIVPPPVPSFNLDANSMAITGVEGGGIFCTSDSGNTPSTINVIPLFGFNEAVSLSVSSWGGVIDQSAPSPDFSLNPMISPYAGGSVFNVCVDQNVPEGTYTISILGNSTVSKNIQLNILKTDPTWVEF